ncbi:MAG: phage terminase large subunit family protein, partial [Desulfarculus sp.]|nr:phage terminase large subunit family protein [Desulfarculus sp.]
MLLAQAHPQTQPLFPTVFLTPAEMEVFRRREKLTVSQWAEKHRAVIDGPWEGTWKNTHTPYLVEPMDTWGRIGVRRVTIVATPQSGKSQVAYNCWGYGVHYKQADAMFVLADQATSEKIATQRLHKIIKKSSVLRALIPETGNPLTKSLIALRGSLTHMAWAGSDASLASFPVEHVFLDETDKYLSWSPKQKEADPVSLAEARITTFRYTGKSLKTSTPTLEQGYIWQALLNSQEVRCYTVRCPKCGRAQIMRHEQVRWDTQIVDPNRLEAEGLAWYECEHCGDPWHEAKRTQAVHAGLYATMRWSREALWWKPADSLVSPTSVAFWFNAFVSPFVSLGEIAA